jgi:hypothetical protein
MSLRAAWTTSQNKMQKGLMMWVNGRALSLPSYRSPLGLIPTITKRVSEQLENQAPSILYLYHIFAE